MTKAILAEIAGLSGRFRRGLQKLLGDPLALQLLTRAAVSSEEFNDAMNERLTQKGFVNEIAILERFELVLRKTAEASFSASPGARSTARAFAMFVKILDEIHVEFVGEHLKRDSKGMATGRDFIAAICQEADVKIGAGSIDEALKLIIKRRGGITAKATS